MTTLPVTGSSPADVPRIGSATGLRFARQVPLIIPVFAAAALGCALAWTASFPGIPFVGVGLVAICAVVLFAATAWWLARSWPLENPMRGRRVAAGILTLIFLAGSVVLTPSGLPLRARFAASHAAFESFVAQADRSSANVTRPGVVQAGDRDPAVFPIQCPTVIGRFSISACEVGDDGSYLFVQKWNALTDDSGIAYLPNGPYDWAFDKPHHLSGAWYSWTCGC